MIKNSCKLFFKKKKKKEEENTNTNTEPLDFKIRHTVIINFCVAI